MLYAEEMIDNTFFIYEAGLSCWGRI